ncbi:MAG: hypothetical protein WCJ57_00530 [Candidatus Falkowbacteria bacterium]
MNKNRIIILLASVVVIAVFAAIFNFYNHSSNRLMTNISNSLVRVTPGEMVKQSDLIIIGTVKGLKTAKAPSVLQKGEEDIVTNVNISVEKYLSNPNNLSLSEIVVQTVGGTIDKETMVAEDSPSFEEGERAVVFLQKKDDNTFTVYGWSQGKYTINNGNIAGNEKEKDIFRGIFGKDMTLDEFEKEIELLK